MSIATEISRLQSAKAAIKTAIEGKGVTVPSATLLDGYAALISSIPAGGGAPAWLKDGDTHLWLNIRNSFQLDQQLRIRMIGTIDWGDGTTENISVTSYTTKSHTYATTGKYRIDLHPTSGTFYLGGGNNTYNVMGTRSGRSQTIAALYQAEVGTGRIDTLSSYVFYYCYGLERVYIPKTITTINSYSFGYCYGLKEIEFQDSSTITNTTLTNTFFYCSALPELTFAPGAVTTLAGSIRYCACLPEFTIPATVKSLTSYAIANCAGLKVLHCLPTTPPTIGTATAFEPPETCRIEVPAASLATYKAASVWSTYASQMVGV
jgi:hypothetical protein